MIKVGITGGIGAGKSIVSRIIESMGFPVFYSDLESKKITNNHPEVKAGLISLFGQDVYINDELNKPFLAQQIFSSDENRIAVNSLIHPLVRQAFENFVITHQHSPLVFNEAAILFETGSYTNFDVNVLVAADKDIRIDRVMKRDGVSREQVIARMNKQWSDEEKMELADYLIENNDNSAVLAQVESLIQDLIT